MYIKWKEILKEELESKIFIDLKIFLDKQYLNKNIYPEKENIFNAYINPDDIKVVILGQDPYHNKEQAHGLSFSVKEGIKLPPSLVNIYKEIELEFNVKMNFSNGDLSYLVNQGVMLLNSCLTVEENKPGSHQNIGWQEFTDKTIQKLSLYKENLVFILWGAYAQKKEKLIDSNKHLILKSPHPSPFSAYSGFFNNQHFLKCNEYLEKNYIPPIYWKN